MAEAAAAAQSGFQYASFVYMGAAAVSFAAAGSIFWRRRRQVARHSATALLFAFLVAIGQLVVIASFLRIRVAGYESQYLRDTLLATAVISLPVFFLISFLMSASGAFLAERDGRTPFPLLRAWKIHHPQRWRLLAESLAIAVVTGAVAIAYSIAVFSVAERLAGHPPRPAHGVEELTAIFAGQLVLLAAFGLVAAFCEEIFVRLFLLSALSRLFSRARGATASAVFVSSFIWATGHAGTMDPELAKFFQVFAIGLLLGVIALKRGIETCLLAHSAFNIGILFVGGFK